MCQRGTWKLNACILSGLAVWLLTSFSAAHGQPPTDPNTVEQHAQPPVPTLPPSDASILNDLAEKLAGYDSLWRERLQWVVQGREDKAAEVVDRIRQQATQDGVNNLDLFAAALVREALKSALEAPVQAQARFDAAKQLAPDLPGIYLAEGWVLFGQGPGRYLDALRAYGAAVRAGMRDFWTGYYWLGNLMLIVSAAVASALLFFALVMLISYYAKLHHSLEELTGRALPSLVFRVLLGLVLLAPLLTGVGFGWVGIYWLAFLWLYMTVRERIVALGLIVAVGMVGATLPYVAGVFKAEDSPLLQSMVREYREEAFLGFADTPEPIGPKAWQIYYTRGLFWQRMGQVEEARRLYEEALAVNPHASQAWLNLGTLHFMARQFRESIEAYLHAIEDNPQSVAAHFNLVQAYRDNLQFAEGTASYEQAQQLNPRLTAIYTERIQKNPQHQFVKAEIEARDLWREALSLSPAKEAAANTVLKAYLGTGPITVVSITHRVMPALTVILGVFFGLIGLSKEKDRLPFPCQFCDRMICRQCQLVLFKKHLCKDCGEKAKRGHQQDEQAEQSQSPSATRVPIILALIPGAMEFYSHKAVSGIVLTLAFFGAVWGVVVGYTLVSHPTAIPWSVTLFVPGSLLAFCVIGGSYLWTAWQMRKRRAFGG